MEPRSLVVRISLARPVGVPGDGEIRVYACGRCGMGYSEDGVTQAALDEYYAELGKYGDLGVYGDEADQADLQSEAPWELERARRLAEFIARHARTDARLVDLGCSTGTVLALLADLGFSALSGVEPLPGAVHTAREVRGLDVVQGWITSLADGRPYDVVVLSHVLEHVLDLREALALIHDHITAGGLLVVEVPDAHRFHRYVHVPYQDFNTEHVNHFAPLILSALIESQGFECVALHEELAGAGPSHPYPVIRGAWRRAAHARPMEVAREAIDDHARVLRDYAVVSEQMFRRIDAATLALTDGRPFGLWGAGQFTMKWLRRKAFPLGDLRMIVDSADSRRGLRLLDYDVVAPADVPTREWPPVVLAGSAYAADSIREAASHLQVPPAIAVPFDT